jgi:hypothetical protein
MHVDAGHKAWGEAFGVVCWLWVFHRARHDLPVFLGLRHPWEHAEDPFVPHVHAAVDEVAGDRLASWDKFSKKSLVQTDDDDDDEEEEDEEEGGNGDDEEEDDE